MPEREPLNYFGHPAPTPGPPFGSREKRVGELGSRRPDPTSGNHAGCHSTKPTRTIHEVSGEVALPTSRPVVARHAGREHTSLTEDKTDSRISSQAILDVVHAVRSGTPWPGSRETDATCPIPCHLRSATVSADS